MRLAISLATLLFAACASSPPSPCTLPPGHVIRWGTWIDSLERIEGYQLEWNGTVTRYQQSTQSGQIRILDTLEVYIEPHTHCAVATDLRNAFVQNQTYVVIGPVSQYVELTTATATARAVWDARFETYGSRHFRAIFRWLNYLVSNDEAAHRR